jgi:hypothetical protein
MRDVDEVIRQVFAQIPNVESWQLQVKHPGVDDDGLWFFRVADGEITVQIESPTGACPFVIETDAHDRRQNGPDIERMVAIVIAWLQAKPEPPQLTEER